MSFAAISERFDNHRVWCVVVKATCDQCKTVHMLVIPEDQWLAWGAGELIQRAIPALSDAERELLISGTCGDCWKVLFADGKESEASHV